MLRPIQGPRIHEVYNIICVSLTVHCHILRFLGCTWTTFFANVVFVSWNPKTHLQLRLCFVSYLVKVYLHFTVSLTDSNSVVASAQGPDTPNRPDCLRRITSPASLPKSCTWTHRKADSQLACMFSVWVWEVNSPCHQVAVVCNPHSKRETRRLWTDDA